MSQSPANQPVNIKAERELGRLTIEWADGHRSEFDTLTLRLLCPCAFCQGEAGRPGWLDTNPTLTPAQTQLVTAHLVGQYAIAPTWADGHDTGYYTFEALRAFCPCAECTDRRSSKP
jgi:Uncharacterized protein conserved in bacteria